MYQIFGIAERCYTPYMRYLRPPNILAGFHAVSQEEAAVPELLHVGEHWALKTFFVHSHTHDRWEFYLQTSGVSSWNGPGRTYILTPGSFFAVPPGIVHTMHDRSEAKHHFYYAAIDVPRLLARFPELGDYWQGDTIIYLPQAQTLIAPFRQLIREVSLKLTYRAVGLRLAVEYLVIEATRLLVQGPESTALVPQHPAVMRARELLEHHPENHWQLAELARRVGVSTNHLVECFSREMGVSPRRYLLQVRVKQAQELLIQSDISITALALDLGFSSSQHFAATFKRFTGQTAQDCRRKARDQKLLELSASRTPLFNSDNLGEEQ